METLTLETDDNGCCRLWIKLPPTATTEEIAYIERLVPRLKSGLLELLDPDTGEVLFSCRTMTMH